MSKIVGWRTMILLGIALICATALDIICVIYLKQSNVGALTGALTALGGYIGAKKVQSSNGGSGG
jgi:hypothetical protein